MRAAALAALAVAGCGDGRPERVAVSGRVLIDGQPLEQGNVRFHPQDQRVASAKLGPGGTFTLTTYDYGDGVVVGKHPVSVVAMENLNATTKKWLAPKKYCGPGSSGLAVEVTDATDDVEIQLSWDGGKPFVERIQGGGD